MTTAVTLACWKTHVCVGCSARFQYRMERTRNGVAATPEEERERGAMLARAALTAEVEPWPCPGCGILQPAMMRRGMNNRFAGVAGLSLLAAALSIALWATDAIQRGPHALAAAGLVGLTSASIASAVWLHPNRNLARNRALARRALDSDQMILLSAGASETPAFVPGRLERATIPVLAALAVAFVGGVSAELLRVSFGWPSNAEAYPPVVGPGDTTRIYLTSRRSLEGYWRGENPQAVIANAAELGVRPQLTAVSGTQSWGDRISGDRVTTTNFSPWVEMTFPPAQTLEGKTLRIGIALQIISPMQLGHTRFTNNVDDDHREVELVMASSGAGTFYRWFWIGGVALAALIPLASSIFLLVRSEPRETIETVPIAMPTA